MGGLSWLQLAFACVVLCREMLYSVMTVLALVLHPAFLLFDPIANCQVHLNVDWRRTMTTLERRDNEFRCLATGSGATLTLVLAPHFFVYNLLCHLKCCAPLLVGLFAEGFQPHAVHRRPVCVWRPRCRVNRSRPRAAFVGGLRCLRYWFFGDLVRSARWTHLLWALLAALLSASWAPHQKRLESRST